LVLRQDADADLSGQQGTCARKTKHGDGALVASSDSLDPADTHHARSR
jgi:hypothetical protein